ncbi:bifunctional polysaccharide deacetylase/glycosyltransferase family 2 protein [Herbidospora cretacea]|uniref:bifunctional polysaccharide deacetylase/glycosyltransferase family 2 protein n=1 Tax=Herbidospora cretacea TaxID=28444 RepID=UPI000A8F7E59|nr:bifunctional polysaccharide deacetylase/glycosyltransferase family 2 protein [Herbidospora cretacea]
MTRTASGRPPSPGMRPPPKGRSPRRRRPPAPRTTTVPGLPSGPRGHWFLVAAGLLVVAAALTLDGYATGVVGETRPGPPAGFPSAESAEVRRGGPVVNVTGDRATSVRLPGRTVALTFNDGPDPEWTPQVLDVLARHDAKATFFVVGSKVARHPELARRIVAEGHELGNHTYSHADLSAVPGWRLRLESSLTQRALAGATGLHTTLARPPHSPAPPAITDLQWAGMKELAAEGHLIVLTDLDAKDGSRPGTAGIVASSLPAEGEGAVVTMRDSGGDRRQTVEALDLVLERLKGRNYRAVTVTEAIGMPSAHRRAGGVDRFFGSAFNLAQRASETLTDVLRWALFTAGALTLGRFAFFIVLAGVHAHRTRGGTRRGSAMPGWPSPPPVTVIVPAYNEAAGIQATLRSLVATSYRGEVEILVVDDGSTDGTADLAASPGFPGVRVIRRPNGGKSAALNTGIAQASHELLIMVDGDTVFERATIGRLVRRFADPAIGAVSGNTKVGNRRGAIGRWQHIEYVIGFNLDRRAFELLDCMATVPGAVGAFRRSALVALGGVSADTLAEDTDLTMALCRAGWRVVYEENAVAWTEAPASLGELWKQRYRWCYGTLQAMWKHRRAVVERNPFGRRCLGYLTLFHVLLPLLAPVVDLMALHAIAVDDPLPVVAAWAGFVLVQGLIGWYALLLDGERASALWILPLQQFVYRQLMYLVVIQSLATALLGVRLRWHGIRREGTFDGFTEAAGRSLPVGGPRPP